jgi:NTP pyrophosphatase (non-canonical NTP hydrolase)
MTDNHTTVEQLKQIFAQFARERKWDLLTSAKDLSMDIVSEAAELMDLFLYVSEQDLTKKVEQEREAIENEVADIAFTLLNFCSTFNIDLSKAIAHKLILTAQKHPKKQ